MPSVCGCRGPTSYLYRHFHQNKSNMEIALWLQSVAVMDQQAIFTETSTEISSMEVALCLQSVAIVTNKPLSLVLPPE